MARPVVTLTIHAPLEGWCEPLEATPDPVFAGGMMGEGLAIDPTSATVLAPFDGEVIAIPDSRHAVSLRSTCGVEVLIHVGIDTVRLGGAGFTAHVGAGARVRTGDALLSLDLERIAQGARSLVSPVIITDARGRTIERRHAGGHVRAGDSLFTLGAPAADERAVAAKGPSHERRVRLALAHGLHARPAALIAQALKGLAAEVEIAHGTKRANARSIVAIMALGAVHNDEIVVRASGSAAAEALTALERALETARAQEDAHGQASTALAPTRPVAAAEAGSLSGLIAVPGFAVGRATRLERAEVEVSEAGAGLAHERGELDRARRVVATRLQRLADVGGGARRDIVVAHLEFLTDPELDRAAQTELEAGKSAGFAWRSAVGGSIAALGTLNDARLRERIDDLRDIESHVLLALRGEARPMKIPLPEHAVLIAEELLPSELVALDRERLEAICLGGGGATSHVAILAAAMDVPMLVGLGAGLAGIADGARVIADAERGRLEFAPDEAALAAADAKVAARLGERVAAQRLAARDCVTADGIRIEVFANVGGAADATSAVANGAEGSGLLRTEFLFLERTSPPDENEQYAAYQAVATALAGRPLVLRLLDVGGDKPLQYLPMPAEDNPAFGLRGIRTGLARPDLLRTQLRAALRVEPRAALRILIPMVTDVGEVRAVRAMIEEIRAELGRPAPLIGAMIETPAAAVTAAVLVREVDFLSVGSNDLSQYTLAMDRGHADLAGRIDALHPAVLGLIDQACRAAAAARKPVAVCGGMAGDPLAVPVLLGLGVSELSVVPARIPATKALVSGLTLPACAALAREVLALASAADVRARVRAAFDDRALAPGKG